jgi:hypothetical protein
LEKPAFSGFSALGNALLLGLFALSDGLLVTTKPDLRTLAEAVRPFGLVRPGKEVRHADHARVRPLRFGQRKRQGMFKVGRKIGQGEPPGKLAARIWRQSSSQCV